MNPTFPRLATTPVDFAASPIHALLVGPWHLHGFDVAINDVAEKKSWNVIDTMRQATEFLDDSSTPPELILLAQPSPGEYVQEEVDRLQSLAPLARIVIVAGTWCEGEIRTGRPPSGVLRMYWYDFAPWWAAALRRRSEGLCPPWSMPLDSAHAGRCVTEPVAGKVGIHGTIAVSAGDYSVFAAIAAALPSYGLSARWVRPGDALDPAPEFRGGIWDGGQLDAREYRELRDFCQKMEYHRGLVVALLDFPRVEHAQRARLAGAQAVFGKPYVVAEVAGAFGRPGLICEPGSEVEKQFLSKSAL